MSGEAKATVIIVAIIVAACLVVGWFLSKSSTEYNALQAKCIEQRGSWAPNPGTSIYSCHFCNGQ